MSKFYPRGIFGPVCDIQPSDDELIRDGRPRRQPEDGDDREETIPYKPEFPEIIKEFDPPLPYLIGRKCKVRTLEDGTKEYYDCIDEYNIDYPVDQDLIDRIQDVVDLFPYDPDLFIPELTAITCSSFDPDINIIPEYMIGPDGTPVIKYYYNNSSPPTFPVQASQRFDYEQSSVEFSFDSNGNVVGTGTGTSNVNLTLEWDDNPNTYGQALGSISIGGQVWTQTSGKEKGNTTRTLVLGTGVTPISISPGSGYGGFSVKDNGKRLCFKDLDDDDCNAEFTFGQVTSQTTAVNTSAWSDEGNAYSVWVNPAVCTLPLQTQTVTYMIDIPTTGQYAFRMGSDDIMTITLNDTDVILDTQTGGIFRTGSYNTPYTATRTLTGGTQLKMVVDVFNGGINQVDGDGNPYGLAYSWDKNPGGWFIKICRGSKCFQAGSIDWVPSGPHPAWSDLMNSYSVYPSSDQTLVDVVHSTAWTLNVPFTGDYLLEYAVDNNGTLALNGTNIATFAGFASVQSQTINLAKGSHILEGTCENVDNGWPWENNPGGLAWKLSFPSAATGLTAKFKNNGFIQVDGEGAGELPLTFAWNEDNQSEVAESNINAQFNNGTGLVVGGSGTGSVTLRFEWDDNPSDSGQALGTWSIGGIGFVQTNSEKGEETKTLNNAQPGTYKTVIVGNTGSIVRDNNNKELKFDDNPTNGFDTNARLSIESGDAEFNSSGDLVVNSVGNIRVKFKWDDNPSTSGKAIDHIVVGVENNYYFTQSLGVEEGSGELTINVEAGKTYAATLTHQTGGYRIEGNASRVCFRDKDGSDCNATLKIKSISNNTTTTALNSDNAMGVYSVLGKTFTQTAAESGTQSATISVQGGQVYPAAILRNPNGFVRQNGNQQLGFKDSLGVKATLTIGSITTQEVVVGTSRDRSTDGRGNLFWHTRIGAGYRLDIQPYTSSSS